MKKNYIVKMRTNKLILSIKTGWIILGLCLCFLVSNHEAKAAQLGVHILHTAEIDRAVKLLSSEENGERNQQSEVAYLTIPFPLLEATEGERERWQEFLNKCGEKNLVPILRLTSTFDTSLNAWRVPSRSELVTAIDFLAKLKWPQPSKHLIVFNEVNHAPEWGGEINPDSYVRILEFVSRWAKTSDENFYILPAAMDLAAANTATTQEAFSYLEGMIKADENFLDYIDGWNSHSYPNPAFSSHPQRTGQNSLRGFEHELKWLAKKEREKKEKNGENITNETKKWAVFITETGWHENAKTRWRLNDYYEYAYLNIWSNEQVVAVTPFLLQGDPGPFGAFSFINRHGETTAQYDAFQNIILLAKEAQGRNEGANLPKF